MLIGGVGLGFLDGHGQRGFEHTLAAFLGGLLCAGAGGERRAHLQGVGPGATGGEVVEHSFGRPVEAGRNGQGLAREGDGGAGAVLGAGLFVKARQRGERRAVA